MYNLKRLLRRSHLSPQFLLVGGIVFIFILLLAWTAPFPAAGQSGRAGSNRASSENIRVAFSAAAGTAQEITPTPENQRPTATQLPPEYLNNGNQTIGITLAAAVLVLIVVFGVLSFMPRNEK